MSEREPENMPLTERVLLSQLVTELVNELPRCESCEEPHGIIEVELQGGGLAVIMGKADFDSQQSAVGLAAAISRALDDGRSAEWVVKIISKAFGVNMMGLPKAMWVQDVGES